MITYQLQCHTDVENNRFSGNMLSACSWHRMLMISGYYQSSAIEMFYFLPNTDFTAPFIFRQRAAAFNFF